MLSEQELMEIIHRVFQVERQNADSIPEEGPFQEVICAFHFFDPRHEGFLSVKRSSADRRECLVKLNMHRPGSDRIFSRFGKIGTRAEALGWLEDPENEKAAFLEWKELARRLDEDECAY